MAILGTLAGIGQGLTQGVGAFQEAQRNRILQDAEKQKLVMQQQQLQIEKDKSQAGIAEQQARTQALQQQNAEQERLEKEATRQRDVGDMLGHIKGVTPEMFQQKVLPTLKAAGIVKEQQGGLMTTSQRDLDTWMANNPETVHSLAIDGVNEIRAQQGLLEQKLSKMPLGDPGRVELLTKIEQAKTRKDGLLQNIGLLQDEMRQQQFEQQERNANIRAGAEIESANIRAKASEDAANKRLAVTIAHQNKMVKETGGDLDVQGYKDYAKQYKQEHGSTKGLQSFSAWKAQGVAEAKPETPQGKLADVKVQMMQQMLKAMGINSENPNPEDPLGIGGMVGQ